MDPAVRRQKRARWLLALGALVVAAVTAELALRALGLPRPVESFGFLGPELDGEDFVADDELFWRLAPGVGYETNELGLRGWLPRGPKGPRDLRIACVGDSCTFGAAVRYEETWGVLLERSLQATLPGRRVESVLAGNPGYSTHQDRLLYERHIVPLAPDVTVLYVGGWNDYVAAVGPNDRERTRRQESAWHSLHLVRALSRVNPGNRDEVMAAFARDEAPFGRRVPLPEYEDNVRSMIDAGRRAGSVVLMVAAPLTQASLQRHPIALEYRAATLAIARDAAVPIFDAPARFREMHERAPPEWQTFEQGEWPCLGDWVHPTVTGHRVIAEGVLDLLRASHPSLLAEAGRAPDTSLTLTSVEPEEMQVFAADRLRLRGRGFAQPDAIDRIWLGGSWMRDFAIVDDATIDVPLARGLRPGDAFVDLLTPAGRIRSQRPVRLVGPALRATIERAGDRVAIDVRCTGRPGWRGTLWLSHALRPEPEPTRYGPFALLAEPDGRPPGFPTTPFYFNRLQLISRQGRCDADGTWHEHIEHAVPPGLDAICMQAWLVNPAIHGDAVLSQAVRLAIPPR